MVIVVRLVSMFQNAHYKKPIFSGVDISGSIGNRNKGKVFCIALGPVTICMAIRTIGLLYLFYNTG